VNRRGSEYWSLLSVGEYKLMMLSAACKEFISTFKTYERN